MIDLNQFFTSGNEMTAAQAIEGERFVRATLNGHGNARVTLNIACPRCGGTGVYLHFGTCYRCGGARRVEETTTYYTARWNAKAQATADARVAKATADRNAKAERLAAFEQANPVLFWKLYRREEPVTANALYAEACDRIYGDPQETREQVEARREAYVTRWLSVGANDVRARGLEEHRAIGAFAFSVLLHVADGKPLSAGMQSACDAMVQRESEREATKAKAAELGHYGKPGDEVEMTVDVKFVSQFDGAYGTTFIVSMIGDQGHALVYKGGSWNPAKGMHRIKATVKAHGDYKGQAQTRLERVKEMEPVA